MVPEGNRYKHNTYIQHSSPNFLDPRQGAPSPTYKSSSIRVLEMLCISRYRPWARPQDYAKFPEPRCVDQTLCPCQSIGSTPCSRYYRIAPRSRNPCSLSNRDTLARSRSLSWDGGSLTENKCRLCLFVHPVALQISKVQVWS